MTPWKFPARPAASGPPTPSASSDNSASAPRYGRGVANPEAVESLRAESPVSEWSENWLAYSPFDAIVFSAADLASMPPAVLGAVGDYLHAGGNVVLAGKTELPAAWHPSQKKSLRDGVEFDVGFGRCFAFNSENPAGIRCEIRPGLARGGARHRALLAIACPETAARQIRFCPSSKI